MKRLYETRQLFYALGLIISSGIERIITTIIDSRLNFQQTNLLFYHLLSLTILVALFFMTNVMLKWLVNAKFLSKLVFGKEYIGGHWVEIVYDETAPENPEPFYFSNIDIGYDIDRIFMSGTNYNLNYNFLYNWETESATMSNYWLAYTFRTNDGTYTVQGLGNIMFHKSLKTPSRYTGRFKKDGKQLRVEGFLITNKKTLRDINNNFVPVFKQLTEEMISCAPA
jgi:hypothetical protein